ncbi:MAG: multidrug effflux MFS transporter [Actinomycetia bacterium]|nr:multidrug effflux MFS transporter [Actinomycetes bacterium]
MPTQETELPIARRRFIVTISMTMALAALAIDMTLPAFAQMRTDFGLAADSSAIAPVITFSLTGLALGQLAWGPLSDALGRKVILYAGISVYVAGAVGSALTPNLSMLYFTSFLAGIGASGARVVALSAVRDIYEGHRMAKMMSYVMAIFLLVPLVAPIIGAGVLALGDWRLIYALIAVSGVAVLLLNTGLPETLPADRRMSLDAHQLGVAVLFVLRNRLTMGYTLAQTAVFGFFASYLASSELLIGDVFDKGEWFPLIFSGFAALLGIGVLINNVLLNWLSLRTLLRIAFSGFLIVAVAFAIMALATDGRPPLTVFIVMLAPLLVVHALLIPNLNAAALIPMGAVAGTASALIGAISILGGSVLGSFIDRAFDGTITPFALSAVGAGVVALGFSWWADRVWDTETAIDERKTAAGTDELR